MPAVRAFALYAAGALTINFIMQITCFVSMMSLDQKRFAKGYYDVLCCLKGQKSDESAELKPGFIQDFINNVFVPTLFKPWCRFITLGSVQRLVYFIFHTRSLKFKVHILDLRNLKQNSVNLALQATHSFSGICCMALQFIGCYSKTGNWFRRRTVYA